MNEKFLYLMKWSLAFFRVFRVRLGFLSSVFPLHFALFFKNKNNIISRKVLTKSNPQIHGIFKAWHMISMGLTFIILVPDYESEFHSLYLVR